MIYLVAFITILIFTVQIIFFKESSRAHLKNLSSYYTFYFIYYAIVVATLMGLRRNPEGFSTATIILGVVFGVLYVANTLVYMKAMEIGPLSYTTLLLSFGIFVPIIYGFEFWGEKVTNLQIIGLALLVLTFFLGSKPSPYEKRKVSFEWALLCILSMLGNGFIVTTAKFHQILMPDREVKEFLIVAFGISAILSLVLLSAQYAIKREPVGHLKTASFISLVVIAALSTAVGNELMMYLNSRLPSAVQFPLVNGGVVIVSSIASVVLFRERISRQSVVGLGIGITALVLLTWK